MDKMLGIYVLTSTTSRFIDDIAKCFAVKAEVGTKALFEEWNLRNNTFADNRYYITTSTVSEITELANTVSVHTSNSVYTFVKVPSQDGVCQPEDTGYYIVDYAYNSCCNEYPEDSSRFFNDLVSVRKCIAEIQGEFGEDLIYIDVYVAKNVDGEFVESEKIIEVKDSNVESIYRCVYFNDFKHGFKNDRTNWVIPNCKDIPDHAHYLCTVEGVEIYYDNKFYTSGDDEVWCPYYAKEV